MKTSESYTLLLYVVLKKNLTKQEQYVISNNYGLDAKKKSIKEIAVSLKLSEEQVRTILENAKRKIKLNIYQTDNAWLNIKTAKEIVEDLDVSFHELFLSLVEESNLTAKEIYTKANIDRKLYSKIKCNADYMPSKRTIIALGIALELSLDDFNYLLHSAGYMLSASIKFDSIIKYFIQNKFYNINDINIILSKLELPVF